MPSMWIEGIGVALAMNALLASLQRHYHIHTYVEKTVSYTNSNEFAHLKCTVKSSNIYDM